MNDTTIQPPSQDSKGAAHQKAGIQMTQDRWRKTHRDFKRTINGQKCVLMMTSRGTSLVPVTIIK